MGFEIRKIASLQSSLQFGEREIGKRALPAGQQTLAVPGLGDFSGIFDGTLTICPAPKTDGMQKRHCKSYGGHDGSGYNHV